MEWKILCGVILATLVVVTAYEDPESLDPVADQLFIYKNEHTYPEGIMTIGSGAPVSYLDTTTINKPLIHNAYFIDMAERLNRERIIERIVHAKAAAAFGYFEVTHDLSDICSADLFSEIGKRTPLVVRLSPTHQFRGGIDTYRETRGFAIKFYTKKGNFDMVGFNTPMYFYKDPIFFSLVVRFMKPNPATGLVDSNIFWDIIGQRKEGAFNTMYLFADQGIPDGYRHMPGFSIHTYQVSNEHGERSFVRFHFLPDAGMKYLNSTAAKNLGGDDQDYATKDLYKTIANGDYPSWTLYVQVLSEEDRINAGFDIFDVTTILPEDKYPLRKVGKLVLNQNPKNHFATAEVSAFCVGNLVPGIQGAPDKIFEARRFVYRDTQNKRLGVNFNNILVNQPYMAGVNIPHLTEDSTLYVEDGNERNMTKLLTYNRDGVPPIDNNYGDMPSYYPNSFNGPVCERSDPSYRELIQITQDPEANNFDQAREYYEKMSRGEKTRLVENMMETLRSATRSIQDKIVENFSYVHEQLAKELRKALDKYYEDSCY